jgi:hypothetical protein
MAKGKKVVPDFIPAGSHENQTGDPTDEYLNAVDMGMDFTLTVPSVLADPNEQ